VGRRGALEVPPLRTRREDIRLLAEYFRVVINERYGLAVAGVTRVALSLLEQYPWLGNVRELEAVLELAMIFRSGDWITTVERGGASAAKVALSWLQQEVLRIASGQREVRRRDVIARCRISREVARRALVSLVRLGLLRRIGFGRGARYVPLSWWLMMMSDALELAGACI
jgi:DNA-binding NtrC family response regulator